MISIRLKTQASTRKKPNIECPENNTTREKKQYYEHRLSIKMKKNYQSPLVIELKAEACGLLTESNVVTSTGGNSGIGYGGGGNGPARAGENALWDDEDDGSDWDQL
jgi:hypothetical protein